MSISQGSKALLSDINSIYTEFNTFINSYGGSITTLTKISANSAIDADHINDLKTKLTKFQSDAYLGSKSTWWTPGNNVSTGAVIKETDFTPINTAMTHFSSVKCRNKYTNSNGVRSHGTKVHGDNKDGAKWNGNRGHAGCNGYGECTANGDNTAYGTCKTNGTCTSNGRHSKGSGYDITKTHTSKTHTAT